MGAGKWRAGLSTANVLELSGKTVGIVGFGNVGRQLARKLMGFDVRVLYHDIAELMPGRDLELWATAVSLDDLLAGSDVVSMHVPLDSVTQVRFTLITLCRYWHPHYTDLLVTLAVTRQWRALSFSRG